MLSKVHPPIVSKKYIGMCTNCLINLQERGLVLKKLI
jgi:hypothetical protein